MKSSISIVIPNYNGLTLLKKHLPTVVKYAAPNPIIIVDDASSDKSVPWIKKNYPTIKIIVNSRNQGFARSVNIGFEHAQTEFVLLLNNDVSLKKTTISKGLSLFKHRYVFAVGCQEILPDSQIRGKSQARFQRGLLIHSPADSQTPGPTLWTFAASGFFRKSIWHLLEGLDELYQPAYWEDIDLGYRAWKAGWQCLFDPNAQLFHQAEATMNRTFGWKKQIFAFKNQFLFFWKNITDPYLQLQHLLWLPYHLTVTTFRTRGACLAGFILALFQIDQLSDQPNHLPAVLTDQEIPIASHEH